MGHIDIGSFGFVCARTLKMTHTETAMLDFC